MNPFYGDSYRYFNGRNLGEGGTILPGGKQPPSGIQLVPKPGARNDVPPSAATQSDKAPAAADSLPSSNAIRPVEPAKAQ
jgi:hypothetical protein